ncbi:MAG: recombinase family protein [Peptococcaceae bacterium]|jgi:DNA invertase Pin-like site-specific DNA recombinase|nr:recombinase family protein [Peptococcaceae bacterium]
MARIRKANQDVRNLIWKIALYIRLSREDGNDESLSIENQRKILFEYVQNHFEEEYIIVDTYIDDGKTGTDVNRPDFIRMEQDIKNGKVNCVIVKSLARAFRNLGDQQKYLEEFFPLNGVRFINLGTPFIDTYVNPRSVSGLEVPIHGMFNEQYAASTSEEVRKTFNTKRRKGEFIGAFAPYGFKKHPDNKNRLIIDEEAANVVKDIFTWFLYGIERPGQEKTGSLSKDGIARELNERGVPCPASYKKQQGFKYCNPHNTHKECYWSGSTVLRILKDRVYIGCMVQGKFRVLSYKLHKQIRTPEEEWFIVEDMHDAIIDKSMFEEVQRRLERDTRTAPGKKEVHLFSGFLKCANCGRALHRKTSKDHVYYFCRTKRLLENACATKSIRQDVLESAVLQALKAQIALVDDLVKIIDQINKSPRVNNQSSRLTMMLRRHEDEYARLTKISDSLYADWKNEDITREEYLRMKSEYANRIDEISKAIEKIRDDCNVIASGITTEHPYFMEFQKYKNINSLKRDMLVDLIDTIYLHENGELTIKFSFADQYQRILDFIENNERELVVSQTQTA